MSIKRDHNMDCSYIRSNLFSFQEKQLPPEVMENFEEHLHSCRECSDLVEEFQSLTEVFEQRKSVEPNPFIRTRTLQRLESWMDQKEAKATPAIRLLRPVSVSFLLLAAVFIGFSIAWQSQSQSSAELTRQENIQAMKSGLNITDFIDEESTFFENN